jgi:hypothetical protein
MRIAFPVQLQLQCFCNNTSMVSIGSFCSHPVCVVLWVNSLLYLLKNTCRRQ